MTPSPGHYLVAFTDNKVHVAGGKDLDDADAATDRSDTLFFDVTAKGRIHSAHVLKGDSIWGEGAYRVIPYDSIFGESSDCPLA